MQVAVEDISSVVKKLAIEVEAEKVTAAISKATKEVGNQVNMPGFRPGKAPLAMVEKRYWNDIKRRVVEQVVESSVSAAIKEKELAAVATKDLQPGELAKGSAYSFSIVVEVLPKLEINNYSGLKVQKPRVEASEEAINRALDNIRAANKNLVPVTDHTKIIAGDLVVADLHITEGEKVITDQFGVRIEVGKSHLLPDNDALLNDREVPSKLDEQVTYPADFENKLLAGKKVRVELDLKEIKKEELMELGDDLAAAAGYENFAEMKAKVEKDVLEQAAKESEKVLNENIENALIAAHSFEVPSSLVRDRAGRNVSRTLEQFAAYMPNIQQNLTMELVENMVERNLPVAERDVRLSLILGEITKQENITVSDEDVNADLENIAKESGQPLAKVRSYFEKDNGLERIKNALLGKKTMELVISKAEIEEVDPASIEHHHDHDHDHDHEEAEA